MADTNGNVVLPSTNPVLEGIRGVTGLFGGLVDVYGSYIEKKTAAQIAKNQRDPQANLVQPTSAVFGIDDGTKKAFFVLGVGIMAFAAVSFLRKK